MSNGKLIFGASLAVSAIALATWYYSQKREDSSENSSKDPVDGMLALPIIDFEMFNGRNTNSEKYKEECSKVADAFHKYGVCVVRDPRVRESDNNRFLDTVERYFESSDGIRDARPEYAFQVGVTPEFTGTYSAYDHHTHTP